MSKKSVLSMVLMLGLLMVATGAWAQGPGWGRGYGMGQGMGYGPGGGYGMMGYGPGPGGGYGMMGYGPGPGGGYGMMGYGPGPGGYGMMGYGPGDCDGTGYGPGRAGRGGRGGRALGSAFFEEIAPLRQELFQKRAELRAVLAAQTPDEAQAKSLQAEVNKLHNDMAMKRLEAVLAAKTAKTAD